MGGRGGPIKLTPLTRGVENLVRKLGTNFEKSKYKTMGLVTICEKKEFFPFFGGKGGSDQSNTPYRGGEESYKEAFAQISKR